MKGATGGELAAPIWGRIMKRVGEATGDWAMPPGVETHAVDELGNVVGANCPTSGATRQEVFMTGTAPMATCYDPYQYTDAQGYPTDTLTAGWWERMKLRLFSADSLQAAMADTSNADPVRIPDSLLIQSRPLRPTQDTSRPRVDTIRPRPDTLPRPRPDTTRPRPDTTRPRPDTTRPRPDTLRPPPDTVRLQN